MKPSWNSASIGSDIRAQKVPARMMPALVMTPPVFSRPAITPSLLPSLADSSRMRLIRKML